MALTQIQISLISGCSQKKGTFRSVETACGVLLLFLERCVRTFVQTSFVPLALRTVEQCVLSPKVSFLSPAAQLFTDACYILPDQRSTALISSAVSHSQSPSGCHSSRNICLFPMHVIYLVSMFHLWVNVTRIVPSNRKLCEMGGEFFKGSNPIQPKQLWQ